MKVTNLRGSVTKAVVSTLAILMLAFFVPNSYGATRRCSSSCSVGSGTYKPYFYFRVYNSSGDSIQFIERNSAEECVVKRNTYCDGITPPKCSPNCSSRMGTYIPYYYFMVYDSEGDKSAFIEKDSLEECEMKHSAYCNK